MNIKIITEWLDKVVIDIRKQLSEEYDINDDYIDYTGLCDQAYIYFKKSIEEWNSKNSLQMEILHFHGEQRHTARIDPSNWHYQHTWMGVKINDTIIYVDPTSQQFKWLYNDIPDYYISTIRPPWYYWDRNNPNFSKLGKYINHIFSWKKVIRWYDGNYYKVTEHLVEFVQYNIWGWVCSLYRKRKMIQPERPKHTFHSFKNELLKTSKEILILNGIDRDLVYGDESFIIEEEVDEMLKRINDRLKGVITISDEAGD